MIKHSSKIRIPIEQVAASKQGLARRYDEGKKGYLTDADLGKLYGDEAPFSPEVSPETLASGLELLGVAPALQPMFMLTQEESSNYSAAVTWRGDFHIPGIGAGHAKTGQRISGTTTFYVINLILDLFDTDFLIDNLQECRIVIGALSSMAGASSHVPTYVARDKTFYNVRGHFYSTIYPNQIQLALPLTTVSTIAGVSGGIGFYGSVVLSGTTYWINRDGVPFRNFDVSPL